MKKILCLALVCAAGGAWAGKPQDAEPAALMYIKKLVGGTWKAKGDSATSEAKYTLNKDGGVEATAIITLANGEKHTVQQHYGIDPKNNTVWATVIVDSSTVDFGHCTMVDGELVSDVSRISGDALHLVYKEHFGTANTYISKVYKVAGNGKRELVDTSEATRTE